MSPSRTLYVGMDVQQESRAVAEVAQDHGAAVVSLGPGGTRPCAIATRLRPLRSKSPPRVVVSDAGPGGSWLSRYLPHTGAVCGVIAPALLPHKAGDRIKTARRDARHLARLMRAGDLTPVSGPAVDDAAMRDLSRARADPLRDLHAAPLRRTACVLRHAIRSPGRAHGSPAPLRWRRAGVCPTPAQPLVLQE